MIVDELTAQDDAASSRGGSALRVDPPSRGDRRGWALALLAALLVYTAVTALALGSVSISAAEIAALVLGKMGIATSVPVSDSHAAVLFSIRLPRVALGVLVGASLGLSGAATSGLGTPI